MKPSLFLTILFAVFISQSITAQDQWGPIKPGDLEIMIEGQGYSIEKSFDGIPIEYQHQQISTSSVGFSREESLREKYSPTVTAKISDTAIVFHNISKYSKLFSHKIIKTFVCSKDGLPYVVYIADMPVVYAIPATNHDRTMVIYAAIVDSKSLMETCTYTLSAVERKRFENRRDTSLVELPIGFGYTMKQAHEKLGEPSNSHLNFSDGSSDFWDDRGIIINYDEADVIKEINMTTRKVGDQCYAYEGSVLGFRLFGDLNDITDIYGKRGDVPSIKVPAGTFGGSWNIANYHVEAFTSYQDVTKYCNDRNIHRGSIVQISVSEIVPSPLAGPFSGDAGYKICNRFVLRNDVDGLKEYLKARPDIKLSAADDRDNYFDNPLMLAIRQKNLELFRLLIENGADPNFSEFVPRFRFTPAEYLLKVFSDSKIIPYAELLCKNGANVRNAMYAGLHANNYIFLTVVKKANPEIDLTEFLNEMIIFSDLWPIQWLVENGADLSKKSTYGPTYMKLGLSSKYDNVKNYFKELNKKK